MPKTLILVGSHSVHTHRHLSGVHHTFTKVIFITNSIQNLQLPSNVISYIINFKLSNFKARFEIAKIIKQFPDAIIHIHQANSYAYHTLKGLKIAKLKCRTILTAWGSDVLLLPQQNCILRNIVKFNLKNSDIVTAGSLHMCNKIRKLCPTIKNLQIIHFGIQSFPENIDLGTKENIILSNRLHKPLYNIEKIIIAYAQLLKYDESYKNYKLIIAAEGSDTQKLKNLVNNLSLSFDQITFTGMLTYDELIKYYQKAKVFVSIPESDSSSLSMVEAMSYGCYPILSYLPSSLEWVINDFNGIINLDPNMLYLDIEKGIKVTEDKAKYLRLADFNHTLAGEKGIFKKNIKKFIALYQ